MPHDPGRRVQHALRTRALPRVRSPLWTDGRGRSITMKPAPGTPASDAVPSGRWERGSPTLDAAADARGALGPLLPNRKEPALRVVSRALYVAAPTDRAAPAHGEAFAGIPSDGAFRVGREALSNRTRPGQALVFARFQGSRSVPRKGARKTASQRTRGARRNLAVGVAWCWLRAGPGCS